MTKKIFRSILLAALGVTLASLVLVFGVLYSYFGQTQLSQLRDALTLACDGVEEAGQDYLQSLDDPALRVTWVDADGTVLFDSQADAAQMENHASREEIQEALQSGSGESARFSATLTQEEIYCARRLSDGTVLRLAGSRMTAAALAAQMLPALAIVLLVALLLSWALAYRLSRSIVRPLNAVDLEQPLDNDTYDELAPLLTRLEQQHRMLRQQKQEMDSSSAEFRAVVDNMREGLILLGADRTVLSLNHTAGTFYRTGQDAVGKEFLTLDRSSEVTELLNRAQADGEASLEVTRTGRIYQLNASRSAASGTVLLIFDVTEKRAAEQNRREFTANVSHELKTPLQSILGAAELLDGGLVREEDRSTFTARIRQEANRMVTLINDILRLSQLDEGVSLTLVPTDLHAAAAREMEALQSAAQEKDVRMTLEGQSLTVQGEEGLLRELAHNLIDNAVKYNVRGGSVTVRVAAEGNFGVLTVADTGIGIPPEQVSRVFERFYRVDKSRSRELGGTGLGLAIVKHAAEQLHGTVSLTSEVGKGTTATVKLPLAVGG